MKILLSVYILVNTGLHFLPVTVISDFIGIVSMFGKLDFESAGPGLTPVDAYRFFAFSPFFPLEAHKLFCSFSSCQS